jgi:beta-glucuronidase
MTRAADRMGLLVWSEIPVYWAIDFGNPAVLAKAKFMLHEEIDRDRNRASIGFWSIGNETPNTPERLAFLTALASEVRSTDNSRLVTAAVLVRTDGNMNIIDDPLGRYLDVIGFNEYIGWYGAGTPSIADKSIWKVAEDKPLIVSEFGADAKAGLHGRSDTRWTEEYQQNVYEHQLHMLGRISQLRGMSPWVLMDFRSPSRQLPGIQDYFNRKGLISDQGEKKIVFFTLQKTYRAKSIGSATGVCIAPESCH